MMEQYYALKAKYADCILLFRLGDFYEMFAEDAQTAAPLLDLTLTSRDAGKGGRLPMCGVPHHAAESYISRLVACGHKVAVCEQLQDPKEAKGVVERDVVRVVTPGTATDSKSLDAREQRYLVALCGAGELFGLAACDLSTGEFVTTQFTGSFARQRLGDELARLRPPEIILAPETDAWGIADELRAVCPDALIQVYEAPAFGKEAVARLCRHLKVESLDGYGLADLPRARAAAAAVFSYLEETQKVHLRHLTRIRTFAVDERMMLDAATRHNLELTSSLRDGGRKGSLLGVIDACVTAMGGRLLKQWVEQPLTLPKAIRERHDIVEFIVKDAMLRGAVREELSYVYDIERLLGRVATGAATGRDLAALRASLERLPALRKTLLEAGASPLRQMAEGLDVLDDVRDALFEALVDEPPASVKEGGLIRGGYHPEVDQLAAAQKNGKQWIAELEASERERTGIKSLKVGFNRVFGYYIEVTRPNLPQVPDTYQRKQTLSGAERFITPELKEKEALILGAEDRLSALEYELFCELRERVAQEAGRLQAAASFVARLDAFTALAQVAVDRRFVRPLIDDGDVIEIEAGRHPVVEVGSEASFVPNDAYLGEKTRLVILTGPNMAGKSTYLRQVALIVLLAQMGSFVPASRARIGAVDRIFTRVGASDDLATGRSTFMVEMTETGIICNNATRRSLVLIDELGRGTSTYDGMALAQAIAEYLHDTVGCKTIMSTHYHELTQLGSTLSHCNNLRVDVAEERGRVVFLYKVVPGGADRSYGVNVARMAGLPAPILKRAGRLLLQLERSAQQEAADQLNFLDYFLAEQEAAAGLSQVEQSVLEELKRVRPESMTPLDALGLIDGWRRLLVGEGD